MLEVHRSNRADRLVEHLAASLATDPLPDPMVPERIGVQSRGMARWLSHQLAERLGADGRGGGITANVEFPFPGRVINEVIATTCSEDDDQAASLRWSPDHLVWPVVELIPSLNAGGSDRIRGYIAGDAAEVGRRRWGLSRRIADLLDRYAMFRPEMVRAWGQGDDVGPDGLPLGATQRWQPELWRALEERLGARHIASRFAGAVERLRDPVAPIGDLPPRLTLFGTSALAPSYLEILSALADRIDVSLYVIVPSPVLWERIREEVPGDGDLRPEHPLLVSSGRLARDFQHVLERRATGYGGEEVFQRPSPETVLGRLQGDLLDDVDRGDPTRSGAAPERLELRDDDHSIQFHSCHGPARQVEVLHDRLLHLFQDDRSLEPRNVIVMTPDIEEYAPLISAVFGRDPGGRSGPSIPHRIADRTLRGTNHVAAAMLAVLDLADARVTASDVLDLLGRAPVRAAVSLHEGEVERIQEWVVQSGIRWGIDEHHRAAHGQPPELHHTWRSGLDRLLLGVAMPDEEERVFADVVPFDDMEGGDVDLLGRFVSFCERLFATLRDLREPRTVEAWMAALRGVVEDLLEVDDTDRGLRDQLIRLLAETVESSRSPTGEPSDARISIGAVRAILDAVAVDARSVAGYETGAVTFCAMIPMRSIPHRVVCLLGMDEEAFPRKVRPAAFDLIDVHPEVGDRDPRDEDRLLLLEAVLAARERLVVLYSGRDQRTNEERAPAVPVGELLDVLDRSYVHDPDDPASPHHRRPSARLTVEHPLQAFSPRNFDPDAPLSFEEGQLGAARTLRSGETTPWWFIDEPLGEGEVAEDDGVVELADLRRLLLDPTRWFYSRRLGMWLREERLEIRDTEPVETDGLGAWDIGHRLLTRRLEAAGTGPAGAAARAVDGAWEDALVARGTVPAGTLARYAIDEVRPVVDRIVRRIVAERGAEPAPELRGVRDLPVDLLVGARRLVGVVRDVRDGVLVDAQYSALKPKHRLGLWVRHLALCAAHEGAGLRSVLVGREGRGAVTCELPTIGATEAQGHLAALIELYDRGHRTPLPLFERSSPAYAEQVAAAGSDVDARRAAEPAAIAAARKAWTASRHRPWEQDLGEAHVAHCYGDDCSFETILERTDFAHVAMQVWEPLLTAESRA